MSVCLTGPPSTCCWTGIRHTGIPQGRIEPLGGLDTYIAVPSAETIHGSPKKVLVFFADAYGPLFINNKLLQDYFALQGESLWLCARRTVAKRELRIHHQDKVAWSLEALGTAVQAFPTWFEAVKLTYGTETTKYVAVGYCFGAPFVLDLATEGSIVAGAVAHPGFLEERHFQALNKPLLLSCAEDDFTFPLDKRRRAEDILVSNKSTYFFQVFSGVSHGFAVRGDPSVPHARWAKEESACGITEWFFRFTK
ncbi:dienelactone hydrolase [Chiua virens]|nr:dienelactone hydrolase [Chiua virens]